MSEKPINLTAQPISLWDGTTDQHGVRLTWSTPVTSKAVYGYNVYVNGIRWNTIDITALEYTTVPLTYDQTYNFYVTAIYMTGEGNPTSTVTTTAGNGSSGGLVSENGIASPGGTATTPVFEPQLISITTMDGTPETTTISYMGLPLKPNIKLKRIFHHGAEKAKHATLAGLFEVPIGINPIDGTPIYTEMAIDLIGKKVNPTEIDYLFGQGAWEAGGGRPVDETGTTPIQPAQPTEGPPDDDYTYPSGPMDLSIAPYAFSYLSELSYFQDNFQAFDENVWKLTGNMSHSASSKSLVSMGTGQATSTVAIPNSDFKVTLEFNHIPTNSVFSLNNANYDIWIKKETEPVEHFIVRMINKQNGEVIDNDSVYTGNKFHLIKHGQNLIFQSIYGEDMSQHYYGQIFTSGKALQKVTWKSQDASGVRQELVAINVSTVTIGDYNLQTEFSIRGPELTTDFTISNDPELTTDFAVSEPDLTTEFTV